ncbi:MAG: carbohydrate ABC transporter permease [Devosia sp.]|nr:carbohydrate ABC transporter permease [Devosia sp.]
MTVGIIEHVEPVHRPLPRISVAAGLRHAFYGLISLLSVGPIVWVVLLSFRTKRDIALNPFGLPTTFNFDNYAAVFGQPDIGVFLLNSILTVAGALVIVLTCSALAAYAIARVDFPGRQALFVMFLIGDSIPLIVIIIPLFIVVNRLGLTNSLFAMIFPYAAMNMGVSVYILRGFFRSINSDMEDAARLDNCNVLQTLWYVILPIIRPGLIVVAIINFISYWNEYFLATVLASSQRYFTLPAGLAATLINKHETNWPVMSAAVVMTLVPIFIIFGLTQDKIVRGWSPSVR